jgi:flagellar basal body-associated protein FliL
MEDYEIEEDEGLTFGVIFRTIFTQKWLALIIAVVITIVGTLGLYFGYSRNKKEYTLSFALTIPETTGNDNSTRCSYPDGTYFYYDDYVSLDVLNEVKASSVEEFASIDVEKMVKKNGISFSSEESSTGRMVFTISINRTYLSSSDLAHDFMYKLASYPIDKYSTVSVNYNVYLTETIFNSANTYLDQLDYIALQVDYLKSFYDSFSSVADNDGKLIATYKAEFEAWCNKNLITIDATASVSALEDEVKANHYLRDYVSVTKNYINRLTVLNQELEDANKNLEYVSNTVVNTQPADGATKIAELKAKVTTLEREKSDIQEYLSSYYTSYNPADETPDISVVNEEHVKASTEFGNKVQSIYDEIVGENGFVEQCTSLSKTVYTKLASTSYKGDVQLEGGMSIVVIFIASLIVGLLIACVVAYFVGASKLKKAEECAVPAENTDSNK